MIFQFLLTYISSLGFSWILDLVFVICIRSWFFMTYFILMPSRFIPPRDLALFCLLKVVICFWLGNVKDDTLRFLGFMSWLNIILWDQAEFTWFDYSITSRRIENCTKIYWFLIDVLIKTYKNGCFVEVRRTKVANSKSFQLNSVTQTWRYILISYPILTDRKIYFVDEVYF